MARKIGERLHMLRRQSGLSQADLADFLGRANNNAVSRLERGAATSIDTDLLEGLIRFVEASGHSANWLLTGRDVSPSVTLERLEEAAQYRRFCEFVDRVPPTHTGEMTPPVVRRIRADMKRQAKEDRSGYRTVPPEAVPSVSDWWRQYVPVVGKIAAGTGLDAVEAREYPPGWCGEFLVYAGAPATAIAVRVEGQSMEPDYMAGDMVVVDPQQRVTAGIACVLLEVDGEREAVLKRIRIKGKSALLESINQAFAARAIQASQVAAAYKVIDHLKRS
ncbi:MAG: LexA repressor [Planctomycetes bacterium ADurb.Bin126]|nr:MAG: LexA repressor [Planctomycetes bacterium ADurb.Bin126]